MMKVTTLLASIVLFAGCSGQQDVPGQPAPDNTPPPPPWQNERLSEADAPPAYLTEWRKAENRANCALIAFTDNAISPGAEPRAATFSGGWAVAYDLPNQRSAFGVAGTGVKASEPSYQDWPFTRTWSDGSSAGYGPEGGTGPNTLAYLRIAGQGCLYNVWSRLGREHLEQLLSSIRFVDAS